MLSEQDLLKITNPEDMIVKAHLVTVEMTGFQPGSNALYPAKAGILGALLVVQNKKVKELEAEIKELKNERKTNQQNG